ncbi:uncharacterized protein LOC142589713 isoform X1 [Dermacentor variabilis]|uniref:uncharacterized protein LOC142589713 isoform X1 n=2 Tax=Dermacentor variabilis TaxID=34621 RepID=UPI003F5C28CA
MLILSRISCILPVFGTSAPSRTYTFTNHYGRSLLLTFLQQKAMVKFHLPSALARNAWRTFNVGLFLIVIGMVPLLLSITSRTRLDVVFLAGLGLVCVGGTLFLVSSCVAVCDHVQNVARPTPGDDVVVGSGGEPVWTIDAPPSYEEAVATIELSPSSPSVHDATAPPVVTVAGSVAVSVTDAVAASNASDTAKAKCLILTVPGPKSSVC